MERTNATGSVRDNSSRLGRYFQLFYSEAQANSQHQSFRDLATASKHLDSRSRFEQVFLASPRARELYSSVVTTPQKSTTEKSFDDFVKIAEDFHDKSISQISSIQSSASNQPATLEKPKTLPVIMRDRQFEVSPFKSSFNDSTIKKKVSLALSRLEDDVGVTTDARSRAKDGQTSKNSGSGEKFTNIVNQGRGVDNNQVSSTPAIDSGEEIHLSFALKSDEEIDVVTTDDDGDVQIVNNENDNRGRDGDSSNDNSNFNASIFVPAINKAKIQHSFGNEINNVKDVTEEDQGQAGNDTGGNVVSEDDGVGDHGSDNKRNKDNNNNLMNKRKEKSEQEELNSSTEFYGEKKTSKVNTLKLWSIKAVKTRTHMGIIVEGQRSEDPVGELWHSTAIVSRIGARCVQTKSGSQYKLMGPINDKLTLQQGFSPKFVKSFKNGFPTNWLALVADHFSSQSSSESEGEPQNQRQPDRKSSREDKHFTVTATPAEFKPKGKQKSTAFKTPENAQLPKEVEMKTTRSGRMVKPPLAWWRGQRIVTDRHYNLEIDPGGEEHTARSSLYNAEFTQPLKIEAPSPEVERQRTSNSGGRKRRKLTGITMSSRKKAQPKQLSTEESDAGRHEEMSRPRQSTSMGGLQSVTYSPQKATGANNLQEKVNSPKTTTNAEGLQPVANSLEMSTNRQNPQQYVIRTKLSTSAENSEQVKNNPETTFTGEQSQQQLNTMNKSTNVRKSESAIDISKHSPNRAHSKEVFSSPQKNAGPAAKFPQETYSSGSNSEADMEGLKKKLFFSPRKSSNKNSSMQGVSKHNQVDNDQQGADQRKMAPNRAGKSDVATNVMQTRSVPRSEDKVIFNEANTDSLTKKKTTVPSVTEESNQTHEKRRRSTRAYTENEATVKQAPAFTTPSPPRRVLRYRNKKLNDPKDVLKISDADSEKGVKKSDDGSDNTRNSGRNYKGVGTKRNLEKRVVHRQVKALVKETASTQSSEEESDRNCQKTSARQARPRASKMVKENPERQREARNDNKGAKGSLIGKEKKERFSNKAFSKEQAFKLSKQLGNKRESRKQTEMSDETPWNEKEIQKLNEALFTIPGNTPMFWQKISRKVVTRTAQECQLKHQGQALVSNKKVPVVKKVSAKEKKDYGSKGSSQQNVKTVTGGVGTIKRKREIRELLEQQDVDYEDDIFDSTPFKRTKDLTLPFKLNSNSSDGDDAGDDDDDHEGEEEEKSETEHGVSTYKTPGSRTPSSRFRPLGPLSTSDTPSMEFISSTILQPVNRKDMDHYIYKIQQRKRGIQASGKHKVKHVRTSTPKKPSSSSHFPAALGSEIFEARPSSDRDTEESGDDYYFSDE